MRISGNYFERLLWNVIPWTFIVALIVLFVKGGTKTAIFAFLISSTAFWIMDTLIIFFKFKNPKKLSTDTLLNWNGRIIPTNEITKITPIKDNRYRWSFKMVELQLKDGTSFMIIDKPQNFIFEIMSKPSRTIKLLLEKHPELKEKIQLLKYI